MVNDLILKNRSVNAKLVVFWMIFCHQYTNAQDINNFLDKDISRTAQLIVDSSLYKGNTSSYMISFVRQLDIEHMNNGISFKILPFSIAEHYSDQLGYQNPSGVLIPARSWQRYSSFGFEVIRKNFDLKLKPEFVNALNNDFQIFPTDHYNIIWKYYFEWLNRIDAPEKFNGYPFKRAYWGQSHLEYKLQNIAIGISTENMWWGPGRYNSLILSNNAPGFLHLKVHTIKPLITPLGLFEWEFILGGKLNSSNTLPTNPNRAYDNKFLYQPKDEVHKRKLKGGVFTWQPKWIPGLYVGSDWLTMRYKGLKKANAKMGSIFMRYAMPNDHAEFYFQYGRNDKFATIFNIFNDTIPRGYLGGIRKLYQLTHNKSGKESFIELGLEITQLALPNISLIKQAKSWYTQDVVRQGFTNEGQVLGAYIGPGSNLQTFEIAYVKSKNKIGIEFQRWLHNTDFYYNYNYLSGSLDFNRQWVDLSTSLVWNIEFGRISLYGKGSCIRSINYQWKSYIPQPVTPENYFSDGLDLLNYNLQLGFKYSFPEFNEMVSKIKRIANKSYLF